jgi:RNA polymerase sigma factor (sigma-70 family)
VEASALTHAGAAGLHGRSPLLRLQSDERLIALVRRGNHHAFEALVARYQSRLLAFCRHMLSSREDAEDVLQEVFAAAFNAMLGDDREINVRPWLYRIARNRSLNHLRKTTAIGVDSMDVHLSEGGETTAEKVHKREEFRLLIADVQELPETQRTALLLREIDALSYEQIAEAMETTVPSVKSLLVRARVSLAEASEARLLTCEEVREELGQVAEGLRGTTAPVRRHVRGCERCAAFRKQLRQTNRQLALVFPVGPLLFLKKTLLAQLGTTAAASGSTAAASGGAAAASAAAGGALQAGMTTIATKAAAGLAAAALVTAAGVEVKHVAHHPHPAATQIAAVQPATSAPSAVPTATPEPLRVPVHVVKSEPATPAGEAKAKPDAHAKKPEPKATPTPTATPADGQSPNTAAAVGQASTQQHAGDTTTLPTQTTGSTSPAGSSLPPGEQSGPPPATTPLPGQPPAQQQPAPPPATGEQPTPTPTPTPPAEPTPTPTAPAHPTPTPTPPAEPQPTPTPTPESTPVP